MRLLTTGELPRSMSRRSASCSPWPSVPTKTSASRRTTGSTRSAGCTSFSASRVRSWPHAAVVTRVLHIGGTPLRTGYVEAVATAPSHERRGLGTSVMRDVGTYISERFELGALGTGSHGSMSGWAGWPGPVRPPSGCPTESAARRTTTPTSWCSARHPRPHSTSPHRSAATGVRATSGRRVAGITMALEQVH